MGTLRVHILPCLWWQPFLVASVFPSEPFRSQAPNAKTLTRQACAAILDHGRARAKLPAKIKDREKNFPLPRITLSSRRRRKKSWWSKLQGLVGRPGFSWPAQPFRPRVAEYPLAS